MPIDSVTRRLAYLGRTGSGKTHSASVVTEQMVKAGLKVVVLDPLGAWWGLRSNRKGTGDGLPVTILGGSHGDIPILEDGGKAVADAVLAHPGSFVIDLSDFESKAAQDRFASAFADRLYRAKSNDRTPLHLVIDEADEFAPQDKQKSQTTMLGRFEALVRRGRIRGIGVSLITQRPAVLNKNVLTQVEGMVLHQITGPQDRKAIDDWVRGNADRDARDEVLNGLAKLKPGEAFVWAPWLDLLERCKVEDRTTFDSSATPEHGTEALEPKLMDVEALAALRETMAEQIEKAMAEDPKILRKKLEEAQAELRTAQAAPERVEVQVPVQVEVEVPIEVVDPELIVMLAGAKDVLVDWVETMDREMERMMGARMKLEDAIAMIEGKPSPAEVASSRRVSPVSPPAPVPAPLTAGWAAPAPTPADAEVPASYDELSKGEKSILSVLVQRSANIGQLAVLCGYRNTGGFRNLTSGLRTKGLIVGQNKEQMRATEAGAAIMEGHYEPMPAPGKELFDYWMAEGRTGMGKGERDVLAYIREQHPRAVDIQEAADALGRENTGGFRNLTSKLRTLGLVVGGNKAMTVTDELV